tara:strand:- start:28744 stop:28923 length:180 start_codon:yes stop_codon:yes gene_type:complete
MELNENAQVAIVILIISWYIGACFLLIYYNNYIKELENRCIAFFSFSPNEELIEETSEI